MAFRSVSGLSASRRLRRRAGRGLDQSGFGHAFPLPDPDPRRPARQCRDDVRADAAGADVRHRICDRLHPRDAGADPARRRGRRGGAGRADAVDDAAVQRGGADRGDEPLQRPGERHRLARRRRHQRHRHGDQSQQQRADPQRHGDLHRRQPEHFRRRPRLFGARHRRHFDRERVDRRQHQLLSAARQFAVDGPAGDPGGHQFDGLADLRQQGGCAFACHQASTGNGDTDRQPLLEPRATPSQTCTGRARAATTNARLRRRWTIISWRGPTTSRCASTSSTAR